MARGQRRLPAMPHQGAENGERPSRYFQVLVRTRGAARLMPRVRAVLTGASRFLNPKSKFRRPRPQRVSQARFFMNAFGYIVSEPDATGKPIPVASADENTPHHRGLGSASAALGARRARSRWRRRIIGRSLKAPRRQASPR